MKTIKASLLFFSLIFMPVKASLVNFLEIAAQENPHFKMTQIEVNKAKLLYKTKYAAFLPSLTAGLRESHSKVDELSAQSNEASLNLNYNVFNGFGDRAEFEIAQLKVEKAEISLVQVDADITFEVKNAYFEWLYAHELLGLAQVIEQRRKEQMDMIFLRFQGGREDKGSYLQARAKYESAKFEVQQSQRLVEMTEQALSSVIGLPDKKWGTPEEKLSDYNWQKMELGKLEDQIKELPSYQLAKLDLKESQKSIVQADSGFSPRLDLNASAGKRGSSFDNLEQKNISASVALTIPLYEGSARLQNSRIARQDKLSNEYALRKKYNDLKTGLVDVYTNYINSLEALDVQKSFLEASRLRSEVTMGQYRSGMLSYINWDLVQNELINYEKSMIASMRNTLVRRAEVDKMMGRGELNDVQN